jgi:hypothetical protein
MLHQWHNFSHFPKYNNVDSGSHYECDNMCIPLIQHMISVVHKIIVFKKAIVLHYNQFNV